MRTQGERFGQIYSRLSHADRLYLKSLIGPFFSNQSFSNRGIQHFLKGKPALGHGRLKHVNHIRV
jgi:hypothetical protein